MDIKIYNLAKSLRTQITDINANMDSFMKMKKRDNDEDFNRCRATAYDALSDIKGRLGREFNAL